MDERRALIPFSARAKDFQKPRPHLRRTKAEDDALPCRPGNSERRSFMPSRHYLRTLYRLWRCREITFVRLLEAAYRRPVLIAGRSATFVLDTRFRLPEARP